MLRYSELHPQGVDTLSPHRAMPHKRGRGEGTGDVGEMKKLKVSSDDTGLEESQSEQVAERRPPVVLFTGISQSAVKKLKTVSICVRIYLHTALDISLHTARDINLYTALDISLYTALDISLHTALDISLHTALDISLHTALDISLHTALDISLNTALDTTFHTRVVIQ